MTESNQAPLPPTSKQSKIERLNAQKLRLEQKKESLKAEAKRIAKAEAALARKTRAGQLVALGLACEAMLKSGALKIPLSEFKRFLTRPIDQQRAIEIAKASVAAQQASPQSTENTPPQPPQQP